MIYEYAIEPEFLLELTDKADLANSLRRSLQTGAACVVAGYPEKLGEHAYAVAHSELSKATDTKHKAKWQKRMHQVAELAASFADVTTRRYGGSQWKQSFVEEHARFPFYGILSNRESTSNTLPLKNLTWLRGEECHLFNCPRQCTVERNSTELANLLKPLLQNAAEIRFVDPCFFAEPRYKEAYDAYFHLIAQTNGVRSPCIREIQVICSVGKRGHSEAYFKQKCKELAKIIPDGIKLYIHRISEIPGGQEIHNRYILTDIGGVFLGYGTDPSRSNPKSHDDIAILERKPFIKWREAYKPHSHIFDWSEPPVIVSKQEGLVSGI